MKYEIMCEGGVTISGTDKAQVEKVAEAYGDRWKLLDALRDAKDACRAALAYDKAIAACGGDPAKMSSYCTAQGDDLDALYNDWLTKARMVLA